MGSQESKPEQPPSIEEVEEKNVLKHDISSTPISTPLDPRSPSVNIARTPIQLSLDNEENDHQNLIEGTQTVISDPRSPTVEFDRTPIVVGTLKEKSLKIYNKNLDNARDTPSGIPSRKSKIIPPKLLESSPITVLHDPNKRKSFVGLLETNIDFTETDLDSVIKAKAALNKTLPEELNENTLTPVSNKLKEQMKVFAVEPQILATPEKIPENIIETKQSASSEIISQEIVQNPTENGTKISKEKSINLTAHIQELDKKLTNLIYEDSDDDDSDKKLIRKISKIKNGSRTPLGVRNTNSEPKKAINKLKVSDKPRKSDSSRIPVPKHQLKKKFEIQCENTPPREIERKIKRKVPQWDSDKTLVI